MITSAHIFSDWYLRPGWVWSAPGGSVWGSYLKNPYPVWWTRVYDRPQIGKEII
jgi:hypothetical protein